jgi:tetratricopeptide (TPR) repeat protein
MGIRAAIVGELGNPAAAERMFAAAQALHHDTSPFPLAWLYFHEGILWERIGNLDRARVLYEAAVERLPQYVPAASHLAGVYQATHASDRAIALLSPIVARTEDPECEGQLAGLLIDGGQKADGEGHRAEAARRYDDLLRRHSEAYANHAARFYLGAGDSPKKALRAALEDLSVRTTEESYENALKAAVAAHDPKAACGIADRVAGEPRAEKHVLSLAAVAYESCGRSARAEEVRARL